jgi:hypothetical protein
MPGSRPKRAAGNPPTIEKNNLSAMENVFASILTGAVAAILAHYLQSRAHHHRVITDRKEAALKDLKLEIAQAIKIIMNFCHQMAWVTWHAMRLGPEKMQPMFDAYNETAHKFLPDLMERLAVIAATDRQSFEKLHAIGQRLIALDVEIGSAMFQAVEQNDYDAAKFGGVWEQTTTMTDTLLREFLDLLRAAERNFDRLYRQNRS